MNFTLGRALAPVVLHPLQDGSVNLEKVYAANVRGETEKAPKVTRELNKPACANIGSSGIKLPGHILGALPPIFKISCFSLPTTINKQQATRGGMGGRSAIKREGGELPYPTIALGAPRGPATF